MALMKMIKVPYKYYTTEHKDLDYEEIMPGGANFDQTKVDKFKEDILKECVFPPVEVIQYRHYKEIIDGNHRATAYKSLGKKIPCIIYSEDRSHIAAEKEKRRKERAEIAGKKRKEIKEAREKRLKEILEKG